MLNYSRISFSIKVDVRSILNSNYLQRIIEMSVFKRTIGPAGNSALFL